MSDADMQVRLMWKDDQARTRRSRPSGKGVRAVEWILLLAGLAAVDVFVWANTSTVLYQAYEDWSFDEVGPLDGERAQDQVETSCAQRFEQFVGGEFFKAQDRRGMAIHHCRHEVAQDIGRHGGDGSDEQRTTEVRRLAADGVNQFLDIIQHAARARQHFDTFGGEANALG